MDMDAEVEQKSGTGANAQSRGDPAHAEPVLIYDGPSYEAAEVVRATLEASGIRAVLDNPGATAGTGMLAENVGDFWRNAVFVAPEDADAARAVLAATPLSEAVVTAEEEADSTTLEQAEDRARAR